MTHKLSCSFSQDHLTWLDLSRSGITDQAATDLGQLNMLTKLHLENTAVTDQTLQQVELENLEYLNLYGTKVTDAGLENLKSLKKLKKLYVWQTGVTQEVLINSRKPFRTLH